MGRIPLAASAAVDHAHDDRLGARADAKICAAGWFTGPLLASVQSHAATHVEGQRSDHRVVGWLPFRVRSAGGCGHQMAHDDALTVLEIVAAVPGKDRLEVSV